ncbi:hypothetical protein [Streptomyces sp. AK08-02]|uniref:hypothetical protein n=1 Tax=Streptomyces sp. AK08-02 TaxID=3028654 RepID=UPI0029AE026D|nr:hypothetical protein [Streptomyces sp. AK08-02]MDX3750990.1 hypothetical protein [Streptomyces sp. AK08-02]
MFKRTAAHVRGKTRSRKGKRAFSAFFAVAIAIALLQALLSMTSAPSAQAVSITECPGGAHSGEGSSSCPNVENENLQTQRRFPSVLYRGENRLPNDIFRNGFTSWGPNDDIESHVRGDRYRNSNYIPTSGTLSVAETFARTHGLVALNSMARQPRCSTGRLAFYAFIPVLGNFMMESCINGQVTAEALVYTIDPVWARNAVYVPDQTRGNPELHRFNVQDEWAYVHRIPREAISGVRIYRLTAQARGGFINERTVTFHYHRFAGNPFHTQARILYNPESDLDSHFGFHSNMNIPELPANPYTRGCSTLDFCHR